MHIRGLAAVLIVSLTACGQATVDEQEQGTASQPEPAAIAGTATAAAEQGGIVNAAFWKNPAAGGQNLILGAAGSGGIEFYTADGERVGSFRDVQAGFVNVLDNVALAGQAAPLVVAYDSDASAIRAYRLNSETLQLGDVMKEPIAVSDELTGMCHYRSRLSGSNYIFAATDGGLTFQYELFAKDGGIAGQLLRTIPTGKDSGFCAVDEREGTLYISEEGMGIWRLGAEPESDTVREPVDLRAPWGNLSDDIKGVAIYDGGGDVSWLVAADVGESRLAVYRLPNLESVATITVDGLGEAEGIAATNMAFGAEYPQGLLAIADEDESDGATDLKLVPWDAFARVLGVEASDAATASETTAAPAVVRPTVETEPVPTFGDAADDPAIWIHPTNPGRSLVIGTNKKRGLDVYDLDGRVLQTLPDGNMNNVDLRYDFPLGGEQVALVTASNRSTNGISVYKVDEDALQLVEVADGVIPTGFVDPYGLCMYRSAVTNNYYVFINENGDGTFRQWRLFDNGQGRVSAEQVREFPVSSQTEGCVADDELGSLYIGEEDEALWKYSAEPDAGTDRVMIDSTGDDGRLDADVEGVALWIGENGTGYLIASNQGADNYAVYRREGDNEYIGHFHIIANPELRLDGASETDGLEVTSAPLGDRYPAGLLVVQDGRNIAPEEPQNFKFVSWQDVAQALGLE
jgi:3-phytase